MEACSKKKEIKRNNTAEQPNYSLNNITLSENINFPFSKNQLINNNLKFSTFEKDWFLLTYGWIDRLIFNKIDKKTITREHSINTPHYKREKFYLLSHEAIKELKNYGFKIEVMDKSQIQKTRENREGIVVKIGKKYYYTKKFLAIPDYVHLRNQNWLDKKVDDKNSYRMLTPEGFEFIKTHYKNFKLLTKEEIINRRDKSNLIIIDDDDDDNEFNHMILLSGSINGERIKFTDLASQDYGYLYFKNWIQIIHDDCEDSIDSINEDFIYLVDDMKPPPLIYLNSEGLDFVKKYYKNIQIIFEKTKSPEEIEKENFESDKSIVSSLIELNGYSKAEIINHLKNSLKRSDMHVNKIFSILELEKKVELKDQLFAFCESAINFNEGYIGKGKFLQYPLELDKNNIYYCFTQNNLRDFNKYSRKNYQLKELIDIVLDTLENNDDMQYVNKRFNGMRIRHIQIKRDLF
ncbi:hypothetical protein ES705_08130 [subsurface metagenome]